MLIQFGWKAKAEQTKFREKYKNTNIFANKIFVFIQQ